MKQKKIEIYNPNNLELIDYRDLCDFQGDLKTISRDDLNKLKRSLIEHGLFKSKTVWENKEGDVWILDGHQTVKALEELADDGWQIGSGDNENKIPIERIDVEDKEDAVNKLMQILSQYGKINPRTSFFEEFEDVLGGFDGVEELLGNIEIPEFGNDWQQDFLEDSQEDSEDTDDDSDSEDRDISNVETEFDCREGDIWRMGDSVLVCGDAVDIDNILKDVSKKAQFNVGNMDMMFYDPPYQESYDTQKALLLRSLKHTRQTAVLMSSMNVLGKIYSDFSGKDTPIAIDYRHDLVWDRVNPHLGPNLERPLMYHVPINIYSVAENKVFNRKNEAVDEIFDGLDRLPSVLRIADQKKLDKLLQRGAKPIDLMRVLLSTYSINRVLDPCAGNGTTIIAGEMEKREVLGIEIDPNLCNIALQYYYREFEIRPERIYGG